MYKESHITSRFGSHETEIIFYDKYNNHNVAEDHVVSFVIISTKSKIQELQLIQFEDKPIFFYCSDLNNQEKYNGLRELLIETCEKYRTAPNYYETQNLSESTNTPLPQEFKSITSVSEAILTADNVCITFGAGISAGYIPTLIEFFKIIGVEKIPSSDIATISSMEKFVIDITTSANSANLLQKIKQAWQGITEHKVLSTPAHIALFKIIEFLKHLGKQVFLYTDNIDGIHYKVGLSLSRIQTSLGFEEIVYPAKEILKSKKTVALICGQSFDFDCILSTINTCCEEVNAKLECFSFNLSSDPIELFKGIDITSIKSSINDGLLSEKEAVVKITNCPKINAKTSYVIGTCHDTLPLLYNKLLGKDLKANTNFLIKWQQQLKDLESFKMFSSSYNTRKPNAEANGYGPGAMVIYRAKL